MLITEIADDRPRVIADALERRGAGKHWTLTEDLIKSLTRKGHAMDPVTIQKELFEKLFHAAPDPIVISDDSGRITLVNSETEKKFGYPREELIGATIEILMPERYRKGHISRRLAYADAPDVRPMGAGLELFAARRDGTEFPVEISLSPLKIGETLLIISILRDISDRKAADRALKQSNAELKRSNEELEQFAYAASHDLQEPLRSIAGSCQMLEKKFQGRLDPLSQEFIGYAVDGAKRMQDLINDLLAFSRVTTQAKEFAETDCNLVLSQVLLNLKRSIEESGAKIECADLPVVEGDRWQLIQLFQNLIGNALKFHGEAAPLVQIGAKREGEFWRFEVRDNGIGIDPKYFDKIFVIFKRLHHREKYPGTGIGLATCKKIVERHGGRIGLESQPGQGTMFYFTLRAAAKE